LAIVLKDTANSLNTAFNGFRKIEHEKRDLVITDVIMPGMDGIELLERVHMPEPELSVIVMTVDSTSQKIASAIRPRWLELRLRCDLKKSTRATRFFNEMDKALPQAEREKMAISFRLDLGMRPRGFGILLSRSPVDELHCNEKGNEALLTCDRCV
jgi:DNA-binding NtrC family response regulator